jgi:hypothetical protein
MKSKLLFLVCLSLLAKGCVSPPKKPVRTMDDYLITASVRPVTGKPAQYELEAVLENRFEWRHAKHVGGGNGHDKLTLPKVVATLGGGPAVLNLLDEAGYGASARLTVSEEGSNVVADYRVGIQDSERRWITEGRVVMPAK